MSTQHILQGTCLLVLLMLAMAGCKKEDIEFTGPGIKPASANFAIDGNVFISSNATPIFPLSSIYFQAGFNETVSWKVVIEGELSGAQKPSPGYQIASTAVTRNGMVVQTMNISSENQKTASLPSTSMVTILR